VDLEPVGHLGVDLDQEALELLGPVAPLERSDDLAARHVERGEQGRGAVAHVVVGPALGGARQHRQDRLEAVECLDLGLLVDAEHDGAFGGIEVQADDVTDLVDEEGVGRELERLGPVGLEPEGVLGGWCFSRRSRFAIRA